jgi:TPR repeat protein
LKEWQPLAKQGNADAQNNLGAVYANNKGTLKDAKQAVYWYLLFDTSTRLA